MYSTNLEGVIDRRLLINYRVEPTYLQRLLPAPFRPKLVAGMGIAGICLIRLKQIRPQPLPAPFGLTSENAAHRIAVEWEEHGEHREGVYIPRRDTSSHLSMLVGGKLFPGVFHHARFQVKEAQEDFSVHMISDDGAARVAVEAHLAQQAPADSIFSSLEAVSAFFEHGSLAYSETNTRGKLDGMELECRNWKVEPLQTTLVESSFFDDRQRFPTGTATLDCALLMRAISHTWHVREPFACCADAEDCAVNAQAAG